MTFVPQEVKIMTSRWQKKADKTLMNALAQNTVATSDICLKCDQRNVTETLSIMYRHSPVDALSPESVNDVYI
jgi:hypothetical protein